MNYPLYEYSLCIALPLMIFFGIYFLLAPTPGKAIFANYLRSRRIMGVALLLLADNYSVHFFFEIRFYNVNAAILMNLSTYFLSYRLFSSALTTLSGAGKYQHVKSTRRTPRDVRERTALVRPEKRAGCPTEAARSFPIGNGITPLPGSCRSTTHKTRPFHRTFPRRS